METIFIISIVFFVSIGIALHFASLKAYRKRISKKERNSAMLTHWNWVILISGFTTVILIGVLKWTGVVHIP